MTRRSQVPPCAHALSNASSIGAKRERPRRLRAHAHGSSRAHVAHRGPRRQSWGFLMRPTSTDVLSLQHKRMARAQSRGPQHDFAGEGATVKPAAWGLAPSLKVGPPLHMENGERASGAWLAQRGHHRAFHIVVAGSDAPSVPCGPCCSAAVKAALGLCTTMQVKTLENSAPRTGDGRALRRKTCCRRHACVLSCRRPECAARAGTGSAVGFECARALRCTAESCDPAP